MKDMRKRLFDGWPGCSNHGCVVTGPKSGMGTNGCCGCMTNASRSQLNILKSRLELLINSEPTHYAVIDDNGEIVQALKVEEGRTPEHMRERFQVLIDSYGHNADGWTVKGVTLHE